MKNIKLTNKTRVAIRFNEVDSMGIVWHGHYFKYLEDGREAFGKEYGISYLDIYEKGFLAPVVSINCDFKKQLRYGDTIEIETHYEDTQAAKLIFHYTLYRYPSRELVATGKSIQVFLDDRHELMLTPPEFFNEWKKKHL